MNSERPTGIAITQEKVSGGATGVNIGQAKQVVVNLAALVSPPSTPPPIIEHADYVARLGGFRRLLTEEALPFAPPPNESPTHPDRLWRRLRERTNEPGVVLVGPGGVGKTRTCFEVAQRAHRDGWRVLWIEPGEPLVTVRDIAGRLEQDARPTLLVFDYVDQISQLDWGELRRFRPQAALLGVPLALVASSRPGLARHPNAERDALFEQVSLGLDLEQQVRLFEMIRARVAPKATAGIGAERIAELCGQRPIIALLIARELERRVEEGSLHEQTLKGVRNGELRGWLRHRLEETFVPRAPPHPLLPAEADPLERAAAAVLACAPQRGEGLVDAARAALEAATHPSEHAATLVDMLRALGWLEAEDGSLRTAHDVVADEVLERVLAPASIPATMAVFAGVLAPGLAAPRHLGRLAVALDRMLTSSAARDLSDRLGLPLQRWWHQHCEGIARVLAVHDADAAAYALGAVLSGPPWLEAALETWSATIEPWLKAHGRMESARHVLYRGLRTIPAGRGDALVGHALEWLTKLGRTLSASFVLAPLLGRDDLDHSAPAAIQAALTWLHAHPTAAEAQFVLHPLLGRDDLDHRAPAAIQAALTWLHAHPTAAEAGFVLPPLLGRDDLNRHATDALDAAVQWLARHGETQGADFVLRMLLNWPDLGNAGPAVIGIASDWLKVHQLRSDADFLWSRLLRRRELDNNGWCRVARIGLDWLTRAAMAPQRSYPLGALRLRLNLLTSAEQGAWAKDVLRWCERSFRVPAHVVEPLREDATRILNGATLTSPVRGANNAPLRLAIEVVEQRLRSGERASANEIEVLLAEMRRRTSEWPPSAGFAVPALLASASDLPNLRLHIEAAVGALLKHTSLAAPQRRGIAAACYRRLDERWWSDRAEGEAQLQRLGLFRPSTGP